MTEAADPRPTAVADRRDEGHPLCGRRVRVVSTDHPDRLTWIALHGHVLRVGSMGTLAMFAVQVVPDVWMLGIAWDRIQPREGFFCAITGNLGEEEHYLRQLGIEILP